MEQKYQCELAIMALGILALGIMALGILALGIMVLGILALGIMALGIFSCNRELGNFFTNLRIINDETSSVLDKMS